MLIAILAALAAGACFAFAGLMQQYAAARRPEGESLSWRLLADLARDKLWVAGISLAVASYGFQAVALAYGPLALVQPLIVSELIFALPVSARIHDLKLGWRAWLGALAVAGGLAIAIFVARPESGDPQASLKGWLFVLAIVGAVVAAALALGRKLEGTPRASLFALAGGAVMGSQSGLLDTTINNLGQGFAATFTAWQTYLLIVASIGGLLLIQSAYQAGPLAASLPVFDATEPLVAITIGLALFNEQLAGGTFRLTVAALALLVVLGGIVLLDTSPVIQRIHSKEEEAREEVEEEREHEQSGGQGGSSDGRDEEPSPTGAGAS